MDLIPPTDMLYFEVPSKANEDNFRSSCHSLDENGYTICSAESNVVKRSFIKMISENCQKIGKNQSINILITGDKNVGKSALTVRFLTRRFIGDYMTGEDQVYCHSSNNNKVVFLDTSSDDEDICSPGRNKDRFEWCDAAVVVYDIGNAASFKYAKDIIDRMTDFAQKNSLKEKPILLVGNKSDVIKRRSVSLEEVQISLVGFPKNLQFCELSAAEDYDLILKHFNELIAFTKKTKRSQIFAKFNFRNVVNTALSIKHVYPKKQSI